MTLKTTIHILEHSIKVAGSVSALAADLDVSQSTVSAWKRRGLPAKWSDKLIQLYGRRKPKKPRVWYPPAT